MIRKLAATLAIAAVTVQPALAAGPSQCVTAPEFRAGMRFAMPILVDAVAKKCGPAVGAASYLATKGGALSARYAALPGDDALVTALVGKIDDSGDMKGLDAAALRAFATVAVNKGIGKDLTPDTCKTIDQVLLQLDPLPAANMIGLLEVILRQVDADEARKAAKNGKPAKPILCPQG